jgi:hypothetical protein
MSSQTNNSPALKAKITPLWIIATFVTLSETVLGYALTKVDGSVQISLTAFVIVYALLVTGGFFMILWYRPHHLYSPAEYGVQDPERFINALKRQQVPTELLDRLEEAKSSSNIEDAQFALIDSLIDDSIRQFLILMNDRSISLPCNNIGRDVIRYQTGKPNQSLSSGLFSGDSLAKKLAGTGLTDMQGANVVLTEKGKRFAQWLTRTNRKNDFFESALGSWGTPTRLVGFG